MVYNKQGGAYSLESAGFNGGRIIATNNGYNTRYFLSDHLGSVRVVVNDEGTAVEQSNYYPYGKHWDGGQQPSNRYLFNGKEVQAFIDVPYLDYGARMYDGKRWFNIDPLAGKYYSISPYVYCMANPVNYIDPDGRWSVSNHHIMTMKGLSGFGISGNQAFLLAYYASVYADNPGQHITGLPTFIRIKS